MASYEDIISESADARSKFKWDDTLTPAANCAVTYEGRCVTTLSNTANATSSVVGRESSNIIGIANATHTLTQVRSTTDVVPDTAKAFGEVLAGKVTLNISVAGNATSSVVARQAINVAETVAAQSTLSAVRGSTDSLATSADAASSVLGRRSFVLSTSANATSSLVAHKTAISTISDSADATASITAARSLSDFLLNSAVASASVVQHLSAADSVAVSADGEVTLIQPNLSRQALWVNTRTFAATEWSGINANSYAVVGGALMGATDTGLVVMDDDANVAWNVVWDYKDFGSPQKKRFDVAYVAGVTAVPVTVSVTTEQGTWEYPTHLTADIDITNHRAVLGKGLSGRYVRIGLKGANYFACNSVHLAVAEVARRIGA